MGAVSFELFKQHVRADDSAMDDAVLRQYLSAAEEYVVRATNRTLDELLELGGGELPPQLVQAVLLLGGAYYDQREAVSGVQMVAVPYGVSALVKQYRKLTEGSK